MALQINNQMGEVVIDPHNYKRRFDNNTVKQLELFSETDRLLVNRYLTDMRLGRNVSGQKGGRGYAHLNTLTSRLVRLSELFQQKYNKGLTEMTSNELHDIFLDMREGRIKKKWGKGVYKSTHDYIKIFKAFWHWYRKVMRKNGTRIEDITEDLSATADHAPDFVYFTFSELKLLLDEAKFDYKVLMLFMYDSGIRSPTELVNVKRKDLEWIDKDKRYDLEIRNEISKTFGRKIKLLLSSELLKTYIDRHEFAMDDFIFPINKVVFNNYLKRLSTKVFGQKLEKLSKNKSKKSLTGYDFRHCSACYWYPRYTNRNALLYRFGWKKEDKIHYYTHFLGMKDTIQEEDLYIDITKTELQKQLEIERAERVKMKEQIEDMHRQHQEDLQQMKANLLKEMVAEIKRKQLSQH